ncbi:MAG: tetratricopeptide repeat protein, partial [Candidatus Latescibacteria bacterium]|nr:tetratricopeptide repeat protein [Candidatus Latescibacterota bacterium]
YTRVAHHRSASQERKAQAWKRIGECYVALKEYDRALEALKRVLEMAPSAVLHYTATSTIGECLQFQHRYRDALTVYQGLLKEERFRPFFPRLSLNIAECYKRTGKIDQALETYERIPLDAPNTEEAALALYAVGELYQKRFNNLQKAREFFEQAQKVGGRFEVAQRAQKRIGDIAMLDRYRSIVTANRDSAVAAQFHLGELYWLTFEQADSAIVTYRDLVERFPESDWAPKALYAAGWLHEQFADSARALATYGELVKRYPGTDYANTVRVRMGMEREVGEARRLFLDAEAMRLSGAGTDVYLPLFEEVVQSDSKSSYAARALYVIGWTYESVLGDSLRSVEHYKRLLESFPTSDLVVVARQRILSPPRVLPTTQDSIVVSLDRQANKGARVDGTPYDRVDEEDHGIQPDWGERDEAVVDSLDREEP